MTKQLKIAAVRNEATGEVVPAHRIGTDGEGRTLYAAPEGYTALTSTYEPLFPECDQDGNWIDGTNTPAE